MADVVLPDPRMIPSAADAPTLTLCACTLLASVYPQHTTPEEGMRLGMAAVDVVFSMWNEVTSRITVAGGTVTIGNVSAD